MVNQQQKKVRRWQERTQFSRRERRLFRATMEIQAPSGRTEPMQQFVLAKAKEFGAKAWITDGNVYAVKGKADVFPCVVAHSDQVHDAIPQDRYHVTRNSRGEWWSYDTKAQYDKDKDLWKYPQVGIGGDDKVGVYIALNLLRTQDVMKIAVFRDEEVGCRGAAVADMSFFEDVAFALECDRRGNDDFVDRIGGGDLFSEAFREAIRPILTRRGYSFSWGAMTDVEELADKGIGVAVANMSCGYYLPHSDLEYCVEADVLACQLLVTQLVEELADRRWEHTHQKSYTYTQSWSAYSRDDWEDWETGTGRYAATNRLSGTAHALKSRGYTYNTMLCTWEPPLNPVDLYHTCSCTNPGRGLEWDTDRHIFLCAECGGDYFSYKGTEQGRCTCGGKLGYTWNGAMQDWRCNDDACGRKRPVGASLVPWATIPHECPHCFVGNARLSWEAGKCKWWCMECMGYAPRGYLHEGTDKAEVTMNRISHQLEVTLVLLTLKSEEPSIDFSDPALRLKISTGLKEGVVQALMEDELKRMFLAESLMEEARKLKPLSGVDVPKVIELPASSTRFDILDGDNDELDVALREGIAMGKLGRLFVEEEEEEAAWNQMPTQVPESCHACNADGQENLAWDGTIGMWQCCACPSLTPPLYCD